MRSSSLSRFSFTRACAFTLCLMLLITSQPVAFYQGLSFGQGLGNGVAAELRTMETPLKNLPDLSKTEQEKMKLGTFRIPEGTPATRCRHHDEKCKIEKKEKISWLPTIGNESLTQIAAADNTRLASPFRWDAPDSLTDALIGATRPAKAAKAAAAAALQTSQDYMKSARLDQKNRVGGSGEDLYSRNYHWDFPLINLPGRAGMDLNLTLNYNSLVWVRGGYTMFFDPESSPISPGFLLTFPYFPKSHTPFTNLNNGRSTLWLVTPSGASVELRDTATPGLYESADSTYTQYNTTTKTLTTSDGTRYYYPGGYVCTRITDRNGNFISISYNGSSTQIDTITDTAGRVIKFNYDASYYSLQSIAIQTGPTTYRTLATFSYDNITMALNFQENGTALAVANGGQGMVFPVLNRITRYDGYYWKFEYNTYGQVKTFRRRGVNPSVSEVYQPQLVNLGYNVVADATLPQADCPRFTWKILNGYEVLPGNSNSLNSEFVFNQGSACTSNNASTLTLPNGTVISTASLSCGTEKTPYGVDYKTLYYNDAAGSTNYKYRGLPLLTTTSAVVPAVGYRELKNEYTKWEQVDSYSYQSNPRVCETWVCDKDNSGAVLNKKRTLIKYSPAGTSVDLPYNLPAEVCEYAADTTTIYRRTVNEYNLDSAYISRRILGLVKSTTLYEGSGATLASKLGYFYDGKDGAATVCTDCMTGLPGGVNATQHEAVAVPTGNPSSPGYPTTFTLGRGNLTNVRRYDVTNSTYIESKTGYNLTGSVVFARDPLGSATRQTSIEYADAYYDNTTMLANLNSFAYPTKIIDPDGYFSTTAYEYYWGAVKKQTNPKGATVRSDYDPTTGLLQRVTNEVNSAYTRYEYDSGKTWVKTYSTVNDLVQANELMTMNCLDGFDRTRAVMTQHPGSMGGYKIKQTLFTSRGQVWKDYEWAETTGGFSCAGDDAAGFCWTEYKYDWNSRTTQVKHPDLKTKDFTYDCHFPEFERVNTEFPNSFFAYS